MWTIYQKKISQTDIYTYIYYYFQYSWLFVVIILWLFLHPFIIKSKWFHRFQFWHLSGQVPTYLLIYNAVGHGARQTSRTFMLFALWVIILRSCYQNIILLIFWNENTPTVIIVLCIPLPFCWKSHIYL